MGEDRTEGAQHEPQYVSVGEAAQILGIHRNTVHHRIKTGRLRAHKVVEGEREVYRIERDSLGIGRPSADVHTLDAQRPMPAQDVAKMLMDRLEDIVQGYAIKLGDMREQLGIERTKRQQAEEELERLQADIEAEREEARKERERALELEMQLREARKSWWRRLFGG